MTRARRNPCGQCKRCWRRENRRRGFDKLLSLARLKKRNEASPAPSLAPSRISIAPGPARPSLWAILWPYIILAVLTFAVYAGSLNDGFVVDDSSQLVGNPLVKDYHLTGKAFTQDIWAFQDREGKAQSNYYRPLQIVLYMILYQIAGFSQPWFHLMMVVLHVINTLLVFHLGEYSLRNLAKPRIAALIAAALFAVHPIHVEAVAWVGVLPDLLMTLLALTTL